VVRFRATEEGSQRVAFDLQIWNLKSETQTRSHGESSCLARRERKGSEKRNAQQNHRRLKV